MGIISLYAAYKYGQRKAEHNAEREYMEEVCSSCGYTREDHTDPHDACLCPVP